MDLNRQTAFEVLVDVEKNLSYSNLALNNFIKKNKPDDMPFVRELVYGVLRNKYFLDYSIRPFVPKGFNSLKPREISLLRLGAYQLLLMNSVPEYAAVSETVELAKRFLKGRERFVNGVLRSLIRDRERIKYPDAEKDIVKHFSIMYSCEEWIAELWIKAYGIKKTREILEACAIRPELSVRVNITKTTRDELLERLKKNGFEAEKSDNSERAIIVKGTGLIDNKSYREGLFSVQDEASIMSSDILGAEPGDFVIDCCAAPGGKTFAACEKMNNTGRIVSMDIYDKKIEAMAKEAHRLGLSIVETVVHDATKVKNEFIGKVDKVICDVPCSGLGVLRKKPEIRYKSNEDMEELIRRQRKILSSASQYIKKGGILLYSTCTVNPDENEKQIRQFLDSNPEFEILDEKQFLPTMGIDGFYVAKLLKK